MMSRLLQLRLLSLALVVSRYEQDIKCRLWIPNEVKKDKKKKSNYYVVFPAAF